MLAALARRVGFADWKSRPTAPPAAYTTRATNTSRKPASCGPDRFPVVHYCSLFKDNRREPRVASQADTVYAGRDNRDANSLA